MQANETFLAYLRDNKDRICEIRRRLSGSSFRGNSFEGEVILWLTSVRGAAASLLTQGCFFEQPRSEAEEFTDADVFFTYRTARSFKTLLKRPVDKDLWSWKVYDSAFDLDLFADFFPDWNPVAEAEQICREFRGFDR